jgi:hypothetical protein
MCNAKSQMSGKGTQRYFEVFFSRTVFWLASYAREEDPYKCIWNVDLTFNIVLQIRNLVVGHQSLFDNIKIPPLSELPDWKTFIDRHMNEKVYPKTLIYPIFKSLQLAEPIMCFQLLQMRDQTQTQVY